MNVAHKRQGASLLEITVATAIMGLIVSAAALSIRTSQGAWSEYDEDSAKLDAAHATALHLVRQLRQCTSVTAISLPAVTAGNISATHGDGDTLVWSLVGSDVLFGVDSATELLGSIMLTSK